MSQFFMFFCIIVCVVSFYYMYYVQESIGLHRIIDNAVVKSAFQPSVFKIYDRTVSNVCNRLIIVSPFDWYIWATNDKAFILNPEGNTIKCDERQSTPAIQIFASRAKKRSEHSFAEVCLNATLTSIIDSYQEASDYHEVPYDIESQTFTILSALNILCRKGILAFAVDGEIKSKIVTLKDVITRTNKPVPLTTSHTVLHDAFIKHHALGHTTSY